MPADKLKNLLNPCNDGNLGDLIGRARQMGVLADALQNALPDADRDAIIAANLREDGELVVICASSAWASRLRYETDTLLQAAKDAGIDARSCRIRVSQA